MTARKYAPICSFPGCGRKHNARGLCGPHGVMARRGEPLRPIQGRSGPLERPTVDRFADKVALRGDGCHEWLGGRTLGGYGVFAERTTRGSEAKVMAHRWAYEDAVGPIPEGLDIDHLCRNRESSGHPYSTENTYIRPGTVHRKCRTCMRKREAARSRQRKAA